jgi:hypothetical protein
MVAVSVTALIGFVALAVDVGYLYVGAAQSQRTADAGALSGAFMLHTRNKVDKSEVFAIISKQATTAATDNIGLNPVLRETVSSDAVIEIGHWEGITRTFATNVLGRTIMPNAVRVVATRRDIGLFFARVMGYDTTVVGREAIASSSSGYCGGIWGIEHVWAHGDIMTDSYDSDEGAYGAGGIYANGDLCSCRDIQIDGDVDVNGDVMHGRGYRYIQNGVSARIWGIIGEIGCGVLSDPPDFAWAEVNNDNASIGLTKRGLSPFGSPDGSDLVVTSYDSLTLTGGTYYFDSALIDAQATLIVTGPTTIYLAGDGVFGGGGIVNATGEPRNLTVYSNAANLEVRGNAGFYGAIYAPGTDILLTGTADYYGTIVGRTVELPGDMVVHVDEAILRDLFDFGPTQPALVK